MKTTAVYIVLIRTNTVLSKLIRLATGDKYTHAAISLDSELQQMYGFSRTFTYNPFIGGLNRENLSKGLYALQSKLPGAVIRLEMTKEQYDGVNSMITSFYDNRKKFRYNYEGLILSAIKRSDTGENRFVCSEFVYYVLYQNGAADLNIPRGLVRPQDFFKIGGELVYEGNLREYIGVSMGGILKHGTELA